MSKVEKALTSLPHVSSARVNLSTRRATVEWSGHDVPPLLETLSDIGFDGHFVDEPTSRGGPVYGRLIRALAVAGFASANVMMLSVAVWAGADASTRDLFHWVSAAIALPTLAYSGRIFFQSALHALRHGRSNMDVPISVGILLAFALSVYETLTSGPHAFFDATVMLVFFLLIGRTLDYAMREKARSAVKGLANLTPRGATVLDADGRHRYVAVSDLTPGMRLSIAAGERMPVDGRIISGTSSFDCAMVTGESEPVAVASGDAVQAGILNLEAPLTIEVTARARDSFLSEMIRLMEVAEGGRTRYRRLSDRVSAHYSPVVHSAAAITGVVWLAVSGDWHMAITTAIAVLIITCPCALSLAVPIVHVVAARKLFENGLLTKDGSAIERLVQIDTVIFDKTGTLTLGRPTLRNLSSYSPDVLAIAGALARHSRHPLSRSIAEATAMHAAPGDVSDIEELAGQGVSATIAGRSYRLGKRSWACGNSGHDENRDRAGSEVVLSRDGVELATFEFEDAFRSGSREAIEHLKAAGFDVILLSGDRQVPVAAAARAMGIDRFHAECLPQHKVAFIEDMTGAGRKVLMVGDGLNDAPSLAAAHVSIAPSSAADIGRQAADLVFTHESLTAVPGAIQIARRADRLVRQNLAISILYNVVAVPIAVLGYVTPLVAALAMSLSSIIVVSNAMRLTRGHGNKRGAPAAGTVRKPATV